MKLTILDLANIEGQEDMLTNLNHFLSRYDFEACLAPGKIWSLTDAADYLATHLAKKVKWPAREDALDGLMAIRNKLLKTMNKSIEAGKLVVNEVYLESDACASASNKSGLDLDKSTVMPLVLIKWATAHNIEVPKEFSTYVIVEKIDKSFTAEYLNVKKAPFTPNGAELWQSSSGKLTLQYLLPKWHAEKK